MAADAVRPIASVDELVAHFRAGDKPRAQFGVGLEHEKIGVLADGRAPGYDVIRKILERLSERGWTGKSEQGLPIALERKGSGTVTLEPGGQLEHSGQPFATAVEAVQENDRHLDELLPVAAELGVTVLGVGFRPFGTLDEVPWMPKGRYRVMRDYLPTRGKLAHEMMKRTATVQANLDYGDEADAMDQLRVAQGLSSIVTSLFAASPIVDGKPSGFQSWRARAWLDTDPDRCGLLPFAFQASSRFRDYVEWALDVPMFFIYRDGEYREMHPTFRAFLRDGWQGERATAFDWEMHLSTLFPEVRLKRYVEVRQADASTREMARALPVLWRGVLYDRDARAAAWKLVADFAFDERLALYRSTPKEGLAGRVHGRRVQDLAKELVAIARAGLLRLGSEAGAGMLDPLHEIATSGKSVADRIADTWTRAHGDPQKIIPALALK